MNDSAENDVVVARIGKPHGLKGEVTVQVHTDIPQQRFIPGAQFATEPSSAGPLTLRSARMHRQIQLLAFEEAADRTAAEALRGTRLLAEAEPDEDDEEGWYEEDLVGLAVHNTAGDRIGEVSALHSRPQQDLLEIKLNSGKAAYLPFVEQIVPDVDLESAIVTIDPPAGLLELGED